MLCIYILGNYILDHKIYVYSMKSKVTVQWLLERVDKVGYNNID